MDKTKNRSVRLKKYEAVYKEYIKHKSRSPEQKKPEKKHKNKISHSKKEKIVDSSKGRKKLTEYQKFVKNESQKEKYKGLKPDERMAKIARAWKKHNKTT